MNKEFFPTNNHYALISAVEALKNREPSLAGMGLIYGKWGVGKSEVVDNYYGKSNAYYVRAKRLWGPRDLLGAICKEFTIMPEFSAMARYDQVCKEMDRRREPLFIDEADYFFKKTANLDVIRDLHEDTRVPIILIGMEQIYDKLEKYGQFWSRILPTGIVEFQPLTPPELILVTKDWTDLNIDPDCAELVCHHTEGDWRLVVGYLVLFEKACKTNNTREISKIMVDSVTKKYLRRKRKINRYRDDKVKRLYTLGKKTLTEKT